MKKSMALAALFAGTTLLALSISGSAGPDLGHAGPPRWSGCFYAEYDDGLKQFVSVNADGTWSANDINDLGGFTGDRDSTIHGVWEQVAPFEALMTGLWFQYDQSGQHTGTIRARVLTRTDHTYQVFENTGTADFYLPTQNPALEEPFLVDVTSYSGTGWRL
jgi:hypothetical protein